MDWALAIHLNRSALLRLLATLWEMVGVEAGGSVRHLPRRLHLSVLSLLRPAEFALRRLIVIEARGISVNAPPTRSGAAQPFPEGVFARGTEASAPLFPLFDPRPRVGMDPPLRRPRFEPRITVIGWDDNDPPRIDPVETPPPSPDDLMSAARLCRRLEALRLALADLPKQARRLARAAARRRQAPPGPGRVPPLRPGWPPGLRKRKQREVDDLLRECHTLAARSLTLPEP